MKKTIAFAALAGALTFSGVALAYDINQEAYDSNPGRQQATEVGAQCGSGAGSGTFGALTGKGYNLKGGADGYQTGVNNSAVCGNRPN